MTPTDPVLFAERVATILDIALHRFLDVALLDPVEFTIDPGERKLFTPVMLDPKVDRAEMR